MLQIIPFHSILFSHLKYFIFTIHVLITNSQCNDDTFNAMNDGDELPDSIRCLEDMCKAGTLQSYGVHITVKPFSYHVPALRR